MFSLSLSLPKLFPSRSRARSECVTARVLRLRAGATHSDFPLSYYTCREAICVMGGILKMIFFFSVFAIIHLRCHMQDTSLGMVPINCSVLWGDTGVVDCLQEKQKAADSSARLLHQLFPFKWNGLTLVHHYRTVCLDGVVRKWTLSELGWFILGINVLNSILKCHFLRWKNILL